MFGFCQKVAEFLRAVSQLELLRGQLVEATFSTGVTTGRVRHQLERPYKGAFVVAQSNTGVTVRIDYADEAADGANYVPLAFATTYTGRIKLWVF